jgi:hypothetical protein
MADAACERTSCAGAPTGYSNELCWRIFEVRQRDGGAGHPDVHARDDPCHWPEPQEYPPPPHLPAGGHRPRLLEETRTDQLCHQIGNRRLVKLGQFGDLNPGDFPGVADDAEYPHFVGFADVRRAAMDDVPQGFCLPGCAG